MHTVSGEVKGLFAMLHGETSPLLPSKASSASVYEYEAKTNKRWEGFVTSAAATAASAVSAIRGRGQTAAVGVLA